MLHSSSTVPQTRAWNNPASIGFSLWERHTSSATTVPSLLLKKQGALQALCQRNISRATGLSARWIKRTGIDVGRTDFVFRLPRDTGLEHTRTVARDSWPIGYAGYPTLNGGSWDKAGSHPVPNTLYRTFTPPGVESNHSSTPERTTADKDSLLRRSVRETSTGDSISISSTGIVKPGMTESHRLRLKQILPHKNEHVAQEASIDSIKPDVLVSTPSKNIYWNTVLAKNREVPGIPQELLAAEVHGHPKNLEVQRESARTDSFLPKTKYESSSRGGEALKVHLRDPLAQRKPLIVYQHAPRLERDQQLPLRMGSMRVARQSQNNGADSPINVSIQPALLPVNDRAFFKTIRRTLRDKRWEAGFVPWENSGRARSIKLSTTTAGQGIAQSTQSNGPGTDRGTLPMISRHPVELPATAEKAESSTHLIPRDVQRISDTVDSRNPLLSTPISPLSAIQPLPIHRLPLSQRSNDSSYQMPQQYPVRHRLPVRDIFVGQRSSVATAPSTYEPAFQLHWNGNLTAQRKSSAQSADGLAANHTMVAPDIVPGPVAAIQNIDPLLIRRDFAPELLASNPRLTSGMANIHRRATRHSPNSLSSLGAHHAVLFTQGSQRAMRSTSGTITAGDNLSLIQTRRDTTSPISLEASAVNSHKGEDFAVLSSQGSQRVAWLMPDTITEGNKLLPVQRHRDTGSLISLEASKVNSHKGEDFTAVNYGYTGRPFNTTAPPLTVSRQKRFETGYISRYTLAGGIGARSNLHIAGTAAVTNAAAAGSALHPITPLAKNAAEMPYPLLRLNRNLASDLLPLSPSRAIPRGPSPLSSQSSTGQGDPAAPSIMAGSNISDQHDANFSYEDASLFRKSMRGASERPLVNIQRTPVPIMRVPVERAGNIIYRELPEDRHGLVSPSNDTSHQLNATLSRETPSAAASGSGEPDADEIAEHSWRLTMERLVIEQERRGLAKWP